MAKSGWAAFPHHDKAYEYAGAALNKSWDRLHRGDCEPYPQDESAQEAWRLFHAGDFEGAVKVGLEAGGTATNAANKAANIYANYLERKEKNKLELLMQVAERAREQAARDERNANAWY